MMRRAAYSAVFAIALSGHAGAEDKPKSALGTITNNQGNITQGQTGNNVIIQGVPKRSIGAADATAIATDLRAYGSHKFTIVDYLGGQNQEVAQFKERLSIVLKSGGWTAEGDEGKTFSPMGSAPLVGIQLLIKGDVVLEQAKALWVILARHHVPVVNQYIKFPMMLDSDDAVGIAVGQIPQ